MSNPTKQINSLDFGCGSGVKKQAYGPYSSIPWLMENGHNNVVGIDININRIKYIKNSLRNGTHFVICDGCHLPFKDRCFSYVHVEGVLHHIKNYDDAISEINRVLDGRLELREGVNDDFIFYIGRKIVKRWRGDEISFFKKKLLIGLLEKKFVIEDIEKFVDLPLINIYDFFNIQPPKILLRLNTSYYKFMKNTELLNNFCSGIKIIARSMH